jgi:alpha-L-rhamnosidase
MVMMLLRCANIYPNVKRWLEHLKYQYGKDGLMPRDKYGDWCVPP